MLMIGTIVMATGTEVSGFAGGAVLYQFGFTGVQRMSFLYIHTSRRRIELLMISPGRSPHCRSHFTSKQGILLIHPRLAFSCVCTSL